MPCFMLVARVYINGRNMTKKEAEELMKEDPTKLGFKPILSSDNPIKGKTADDLLQDIFKPYLKRMTDAAAISPEALSEEFLLIATGPEGKPAEGVDNYSLKRYLVEKAGRRGLSTHMCETKGMMVPKSLWHAAYAC